jgi:hypothetical protein
MTLGQGCTYAAGATARPCPVIILPTCLYITGSSTALLELVESSCSGPASTALLWVVKGGVSVSHAAAAAVLGDAGEAPPPAPLLRAVLLPAVALLLASMRRVTLRFT